MGKSQRKPKTRDLKKNSRGWVKMSLPFDLYWRIKEANIKTGQYYIGGVWIPRWVREAIELYGKTEDFAGLSLVEFLSGLKPDV